MKCFECGGEVVNAVGSLTLMKEGKPVIVRGVKMKQCRQCGEEYVPGEVAEKVSKLLDHKIKPIETINVPVISMTGTDE